MLKIELRDLFYGFIRNYWSFGVRSRSSSTKYTHKILGYFSNLGQMLGIYVNYEVDRNDLSWFYTREDFTESAEPILHVEHENVPDRLGEMLRKIKKSPSNSTLGIGYVTDERNCSRFIKKLEKLNVKLGKQKEFLVILDKRTYDSDEPDIIGYYGSWRRSTLDPLPADCYRAADGLFYACYDNVIQEEENNEDECEE